MKFRHLLLFLFAVPTVACGQFHITGRVTDILSHRPVENASVFLSNTQARAKTNDDGTFDIANVHAGHYDLVVSIVGYVTYHQNVNVTANIEDLKLPIEAKVTTLKEVRIGPDDNWDRNYRYFKKQFLGWSENAGNVKILNPEVLSLNLDAGKREFTASSSDFLEIENRALGYKIRYLLSNLTTNYTKLDELSVYYEGSPYFEDMKGKPAEIKKWQKKRREAYLGSEMHFLRSVIANRVAEEGFTVRKLIRDPNPDYPQWSSKRYTETLVKIPLTLKDYFRQTDQKGQYALSFKDCLYITWHGNASVMKLTEPYAYFDDNGIVINPQSLITEEAWGTYRMAEMLPVDYQPE